MSLIARHLEAHGIPTLCLGSALDILRAGKPPRAVFVDYPLGHSAGKPFDESDQRGVVGAALRALETIRQPGTVESLPNVWGSDEWRETASSSLGGDTRQPRDETPQFQLPADRKAAIESGALPA